MQKLFTILFIHGALLVLCWFWKGGEAFLTTPVEASPFWHSSALAAPATRQEAITGTVVAFLSKEPLAGVNIIIKGTMNGATTDIEGQFTLQASPEDTLIFSFIGYETREVPLEGRTEIDIALMEDIGILGELEIVSTGYQQLPKERATGSFVHLDNETINRSVSTGILERMEGVTSGLIFNRNGPAGDELSIRGRSTLFANSQPLIVVDNFPYDGDINNINPNDVESITVLKDAAAASIWGARAGNGVIVITTKKGAYDQAPQVSFNANVTMGERPDPFYAPQMTVSDFVDIERMLFDQGYYAFTESSPANAPLTPVVELLIAQRDGEISSEEANTQIEALKQQDIRRDYEDYLYRKSLDQQYAINVRGGSERQRYRLSAGYDRNLENLSENRFERITLNARHTLNLLNDKLELSTGIYYVKGHDQNNGLSPNSLRMSSGSPMYPYGRLADAAGNPLPVIQDYRESFVLEAQEAGLLDWRYRPLEEMGLSDNTSSLTDYRLNAQVNYKILPHLQAEVLYQYWGNQRSNRQHHPLESYFARDLINTFTQVAEDGSLEQAIPEGGILDVSNRETDSHNLRAQLRYEGNLGDRHALSAIAGYEVRDMNSESTDHRYYGYDDDLAISSYVDYAGFYNRYNYPLFSKQIPYVDQLSSLTDRFVSYYANAAYTYDNRYTLSLSGRKDMSNLFGVDANQRGVPLWSAGLAWNLSEEGFYKSGIMPYLKLRATYGYNGNIDKTVSAYTTARIAGTSFRTGLPYARITNPPNPELRWEQVKVLNLGVDFELKDGIVSGSLEYYTKQGLDLIGDAPFPPSSGITEFRGNTANTRGNGVDVVLHTRNINRAFQWETNFLFSYIKEEVTDYKAEESVNNYLTFGSGSLGMPVPLEGRPLFSLYSYRWAGLDPATGDPQGFLEGEVSKEYKAIIDAATTENIIYNGPARPTAFGALRNTFSWKGLSLSVNISYRVGYYFRRNSIRYSSVLTAQGGHSDYALRWQQPGDEAFTQVPSMPEDPDINRDNMYTYSEILVEKGDHVRLQDVNLSYTLDRGQLPGLPFDRVQIYAYASNLGILWKATDTVKDPDYRTMPPLRTLSLGLRADF